MKKTKLKRQPKWIARVMFGVGAVAGLIISLHTHPIGGTNAQNEPGNPSEMSGRIFEDNTFGTTTLTICDLNDNTKCITLMDRNLGATSNDITNTGSYGNYYQWGNNHPFAHPGVNGEDEVYNAATSDRASWDDSYSNHGYDGPITNFMRGSDYWTTSSEHHDDLWGGSGDSIENNRGYNTDVMQATNVSDRQGPCPENYHVPSKGEWIALMDLWSNSNTNGEIEYSSQFQEDFNLPLAGVRYMDAQVIGVGEAADLWSSSPYADSANARDFGINQDRGRGGIDSGNRTAGLSIRCFKNEPIQTVQVTFWDGTGEEKTELLSKKVRSGGYVESLEAPKKLNSYISFVGWYTDEELTQEFDFDTEVTQDLNFYPKREEGDIRSDRNGNSFVREDITYCGVSNDGESGCIILMDRNLGGSDTWTYGYYYQWGNNYGFDRNNGYSLRNRYNQTQEKVERNDLYDNGGYYGTMFVTYIDSPYDYRENDGQHDGLWGGAEDSDDNNLGYDLYNHKDRQGPCPEGYHVPSAGERSKLIEYYDNSFGEDTTDKHFFYDFMLYLGQRIYGQGWRDFYAGNQGRYWSSSPAGIRSWYLATSEYGAAVYNGEGWRTYGHMIRCFKNIYPIIFETNGGDEVDKQTVVENATVVRPNDPEKSGFVFMGRYASGSNNEFDFENTLIDKAITLNAKRGYMYTITDRDGTILKTGVVVEGGNIEISEIPQREGYRFVGWDKELNNISQDTVITAQYEKIVVSHGGGGSSISKDYCPNGDYSDSYYDGICGEKNITQDSQIVQDNDTPVDGHNSAGEFEYDSLKANPNYSDEMNEAYQYAYHYGITTMESIKEADMGGSLTRIAMAKMLSQYAINVLGQIPDTSKNNKFKDVSDQMNSEYDNGVTLAYQLGIMGINVPDNKFRPFDLVTRAEFVTALSRLLYNTPEGTFEKTSKYYIPHMDKLVYEGIITNTDPNMKELRGYVMLMLMRAK